jgi:hypothetical protein
MPGPLEHLVVVEAAQSMPVAIAAMLLADHGADVIKVEPTGGAFFAHDLSRKAWDRGKRSGGTGHRDGGGPRAIARPAGGGRPVSCTRWKRTRPPSWGWMAQASPANFRIWW